MVRRNIGFHGDLVGEVVLVRDNGEVEKGEGFHRNFCGRRGEKHEEGRVGFDFPSKVPDHWSELTGAVEKGGHGSQWSEAKKSKRVW
ncbi:hypothetical protein HAX54_014830 [Datura stramonium]|uniref:Uncharacterized protein n=1 Tax=Datura stramonium TaxID=4076 RepID=A0ABS8TQL1_DATST|nr:hypothetical protein [Datura stramonium]